MRGFKTWIIAGTVASALASAAGATTLSVHGTSGFGAGPYSGAEPDAGPATDRGASNVSEVIFSAGRSIDNLAQIKFSFLGKEADYSNDAVEIAGGIPLRDEMPGAFLDFIQISPAFVKFRFAMPETVGIGDRVGSAEMFLDAVSGRVFGAGRTDHGSVRDATGGSGTGGSGTGGSGTGGGADGGGTGGGEVPVDVAIVPLPAGGLLLLSALGAFAALRRRKGSRKQAGCIRVARMQTA